MPTVREQPRPGHPIARLGKRYIWVTHLARALAGAACLKAPWFKSRYQYVKYEEQASDLVAWNREHTALMRERVAQLEAEGYTVKTEGQNDFKLEGELAIVAGKPDAVATRGNRILIVDGKTGRERESDYWQVLIYLYAWQRKFAGQDVEIRGEVFYKGGEFRELGVAKDLTQAHIDQMVAMIKRIAAADAPPTAPSRSECRFCNVGPMDCPDRVIQDVESTAVSGF